MQNAKFRNLEDLRAFLPPDELELVNRLRDLVLDCVPHVTERLSFNVPYYKRHADICFIWPASVLWGSKKTYSGVRMGFSKGHLLADGSGYLDRGKRKQVFWRDLEHLTQEDLVSIKALLYQAVLADEEKAGEKATGASQR